MAITHVSRKGKTYYLHSGPKRGGGIQHYFSSKPKGILAEVIPEGYEIYEEVNGKVFLRRAQPKEIQDDEHACIARPLASRRSPRCMVETRGKMITIFEGSGGSSDLEGLATHLSRKTLDELADRFAYYQPVLRFILVDEQRRLFAPERFCFRGSVDDWIPIGAVGTIQQMAERYLKHLGKDSMYDLY